MPRSAMRKGAVVLVLLAGSPAALAEDAAPPDGPPADEQPAARAPAATGTRIRSPGAAPFAPVTVLTREQIAASGRVSLADLLRTLPEQGNATNAGVNDGGGGSIRLALRGIGPARTLVLVNGRRWMPGGTGADESVDLGSIPSAAVERIEMLKGAASAVYGADAVAGAVNVVMRGGGGPTDVSAYTGTSSRRDGTVVDVALTTGAGGERANVLLSADYLDERRVLARDRPFSRVPWYFDANGQNNPFGHVGPYAAGSGTIPAGRTLAAGASGPGNTLWNDLVATGADSFVWDPAAARCGTSASGQRSCFRPYAGAGLPEAGDPGDGYNFAAEYDLVTPRRRVSLFSTGGVKLGATRAFFEASYVNRRSGQDLAPEPFVGDGEGVPVSAQNAYNPFGADVYVRRRLVELGDRTLRQDLDMFRVLGGLDGTLPDALGPLQGWGWDASVGYGRTQGTNTKRGNLYLPALAAALGPSFLEGTDASGNAVFGCGTPVTPIVGCVPLNLFGGPGSVTPQQLAALTFTGKARGTNTLTSVQANATGPLGRLGGDRPVALAAGYEYRALAGSFTNDPVTAAGLTTGNRGIDTHGRYHVNEVYGELSIPLARGMALADDLEASAALRWSGYSTFGTASSYTFGARWRPIRDVTVRGTRSKAFRAPTIQESFGGPDESFPYAPDPCRGPSAGGPLPGAACLAAGVPAFGSGDFSGHRPTIQGGNPDVGPETANAYTFGVVVEPRWVRNLSVSVDYYSIALDGTIGSIGAAVLLAGCYDGTHPEYCNRIVRNPVTHFIDLVDDRSGNAGTLATAGVDLAVRYALPTPGAGRFAFSLDATWLQKVDQTLPDGTVVHGKGTYDLSSLNSPFGAGGTFPAWKAGAGVTWGRGGLGAGVSTRFIGGFHECGDSNGDFAGAGLCYVDSTYARHVAAYHAEDLFLSYALSSRLGKTTFTAGVLNVLDASPARIYDGAFAATDPYSYEQMGRFFYLRLAQAY